MTQSEETQEKLWVHLDLMVITLRGLEAVTTREEAEALAAAAGVKLTNYTEDGNGRGGETTAVLHEPFTTIRMTRNGGPESGETEIMVQMEDMDGSLREELEWAAVLLEQAVLLTWERDEDAEQAILEDTGVTGKEYQYWSESITTLPAEPSRAELREILMTTYTVGARFLLKDVLAEENPGG